MFMTPITIRQRVALAVAPTARMEPSAFQRRWSKFRTGDEISSRANFVAVKQLFAAHAPLSSHKDRARHTLEIIFAVRQSRVSFHPILLPLNRMDLSHTTILAVFGDPLEDVSAPG
jgi:hypothetical protein